MSYAPVLSSSQIERLSVLAKPRSAGAGEVLYEPGDPTPPVFVVLLGAIEIVAVGSGSAKKVTTYTSGQFSGELLMIAGRRSMYRCRAVERSDLLELSAEALAALIATDAELSEVLMGAFIARRRSLREAGHSNTLIIGSGHSANTLALREFLARDGHPFTYIDVDADVVGKELLNRFGASPSDIPVVVCNDDEVLRDPSPRQMADTLGFNRSIATFSVFDVLIVGAGPAGLAAAVYGASEGLETLVVERNAPGGQAGSSSKIENYLGFPVGLSGNELASAAIAQAEKFGAKLLVARTVRALNCEERPYIVTLDDGETIRTRSIVLATGAQYNRPPISNLDQFAGRGIHYSATFMEAQLCDCDPVIVIGGGNSAGQAALYLSQTSSTVHILVRSKGLAESMSRYLVQRIEASANIHVHYSSELVGLEGSTHLERVIWVNKLTQERTTQAISHVFVMAGASPQTAWLTGCVALDRKGFVVTGRDLDLAQAPIPWLLARSPHMMETSLPGVFAVGDARSGNIKRVASAVGEGSIVVSMVHQMLSEG